MTRLSLQVVYLWGHVSSTAPPFILWWSNLEILFGPLPRSSPCIGGLRCRGNANGTWSVYSRERIQKAVYIVRCLCLKPCSYFCRELFPSAEFRYVPGAGHWVHSQKPKEFLDLLLPFLSRYNHSWFISCFVGYRTLSVFTRRGKFGRGFFLVVLFRPTMEHFFIMQTNVTKIPNKSLAVM
jgi:hypothetical protein